MRLFVITHPFTRGMLLLAVSAALALQGTASSERTLAMIKPDAHEEFGTSVVVDIAELGFKVVEISETRLSKPAAVEFYKEHEGRPFFPDLIDFMTSGTVAALILEKDNAVAAWRQTIGPTDSNEARASAPATLRAKYGTDKTRNALHGSDSTESAEREIAFFFPHLVEGSDSTTPPGGARKSDKNANEGAHPENSYEAKAQATQGASVTAADLEDLSMDEIAAKVFGMAQELGVDIDSVVESLSAQSAAAPADVDADDGDVVEVVDRSEL